MAIHSCTKITHSYTNNDGNSFMYNTNNDHSCTKITHSYTNNDGNSFMY